MYDDALPRKRKNDEYRQPVLVALARWLWRALRFVFRVFVKTPLRWLWRVVVWSVKAPFRFLGWTLHGLNSLINGRMPELETAREREIYRRIRRRFRRRNRLYTHMLVFIVGIASLWVERANRLYGSPFHPMEPYVFFTMMWTALLVFHYMRVRMGEAEDDALEAALEREYQREARSQPVYYEEVEEYYGDTSHLADAHESDIDVTDWPKAKRRRLNS